MNGYSKKYKELKKQRKSLRKKAVTVLKICGFENCKFIGRGTYGDVIRCNSLDSSGEKVAVKIVAREKESWGESTVWMNFDHLNIVPLLDMIRTDNFDAFLMPFYPKTLDAYLKDKSFHRMRSSYDVARGWLKDILTGLEYLHTRDMCHLDLKVNNILVTTHLNAVICDFTFISSTRQTVKRFGLPRFYGPPETCVCSADNRPIEGVPFDVWSFGMIALHIFAGKWFRKYIIIMEPSWHEHVYPLLFYCLQIQAFRKLLKSTFPRTAISNSQTEEALNLVQAVLRYNLKDRPEVSRILEHSVITKDTKVTFFEVDRMWIDYYN